MQRTAKRMAALLLIFLLTAFPLAGAKADGAWECRDGVIAFNDHYCDGASGSGFSSAYPANSCSTS